VDANDARIYILQLAVAQVFCDLPVVSVKVVSLGGASANLRTRTVQQNTDVGLGEREIVPNLGRWLPRKIAGLENAPCECYEVASEQFGGLLRLVSPPSGDVRPPNPQAPEIEAAHGRSDGARRRAHNQQPQLAEALLRSSLFP
jgi:hypothetical protein